MIAADRRIQPNDRDGTERRGDAAAPEKLQQHDRERGDDAEVQPRRHEHVHRARLLEFLAKVRSEGATFAPHRTGENRRFGFWKALVNARRRPRTQTRAVQADVAKIGGLARHHTRARDTPRNSAFACDLARRGFSRIPGLVERHALSTQNDARADLLGRCGKCGAPLRSVRKAHRRVHEAVTCRSLVDDECRLASNVAVAPREGRMSECVRIDDSEHEYAEERDSRSQRRKAQYDRQRERGRDGEHRELVQLGGHTREEGDGENDDRQAPHVPPSRRIGTPSSGF